MLFLLNSNYNMKNIFKVYFAFLLGFLVFGDVQAQVKMQSGQFLNGFVVTNAGDTLKGVLELFDEVSSCKEVRFKERMVDLNTTIFKPDDILAYQRKDEKYVSYDDVYCLLRPCMNEDYHKVFIKLIKEDVLKVYMYAANHHTSHFYAVKYIPVVQKKGFEPIPYKTKKHIKKTVSAYFTDYPELAEKLRNYDYKYEDFDQVVEDYTNWSKIN